MNIDLNKLAAPLAVIIALSGMVGSGYVALEKIDRLESDRDFLMKLSDDNMNNLIRLESVSSDIEELSIKLDDHINKPKPKQ